MPLRHKTTQFEYVESPATTDPSELIPIALVFGVLPPMVPHCGGAPVSETPGKNTTDARVVCALASCGAANIASAVAPSRIELVRVIRVFLICGKD
ncbi:MAG: hypothetical protein MUF14_02480 [Hyphomonadaceae bacterium]|nr:hypothetical protein [Hyphomonadaceae bacterium]